MNRFAKLKNPVVGMHVYLNGEKCILGYYDPLIDGNYCQVLDLQWVCIADGNVFEMDLKVDLDENPEACMEYMGLQAINIFDLEYLIHKHLDQDFNIVKDLIPSDCIATGPGNILGFDFQGKLKPLFSFPVDKYLIEKDEEEIPTSCQTHQYLYELCKKEILKPKNYLIILD